MLTHRACEVLTEVIIYGMVIFNPWAFGTTQPWSIWTMNVLGYTLGLLCASKRISCWQTGYRPRAWNLNQITGGLHYHTRCGLLSLKWLTAGLALVQFAVLSYCLLSAVNARANYLPAERRFEYFPCIEWLPHSFDGRSSWVAFWTYLGLACSFWAVRDWLLGYSTMELPGPGAKPSSVRIPPVHPGPDRLGRLLWVLSLNGGALALEGIAQRLTQSPKLLFLIQPHLHQTAVEQFGPFAYRANAAEYFNLLWPVSLGFWYARARRQAQVGDGLKNCLLLGCVVCMAACPMISTSRAGALVSLALFAGVALSFLGTELLLPKRKPAVFRFKRPRLPGIVLFLAGVPALGLALGWGTLGPRLTTLQQGYAGRQALYRVARQIAADFPLYGTGPGTYASVSELYWPNRSGLWPAQVHNDWLEARITFGIVGSCLLSIGGVLVVLRWLLPTGLPGSLSFLMFIWLALLGCLVHARFDFPFQVHSILFLFVVFAAVLFTLSRHTAATAPNA